MLDPKLQNIISPDTPRAELERVVEEVHRAIVGPSYLQYLRENGVEGVPPEDSALDKLIQKGWLKDVEPK